MIMDVFLLGLTLTTGGFGIYLTYSSIKEFEGDYPDPQCIEGFVVGILLIIQAMLILSQLYQLHFMELC